MAEKVDIERLIRISKENPLLPEKFIPWEEDIAEGHHYLGKKLISLEGLQIYETLTLQQKLELSRHEVVQSMYAYAWSEGLFCLFMNRYILTLPPDHIEYRFLLRELIEEFRHQEMFSMAITRLKGEPVKQSPIQNFIGLFTASYFPADTVFMVSLTLELIADMYGEHIRNDEKAYRVLQKVSQLHNIEEARHILFTKNLLSRFIQKAGFLKRSWYSLAIVLNVLFFQRMYVKREIFERIGLKDSKKIYKIAYANYQQKFARECLGSITDFVKSFNGFNWITKPVWKVLLKYEA
ncbi:MAG: diiron oxygenase [Bacteroidota bacterium]